MLYQLLVVFIAFQLASSQISCYDCLGGTKKFNYIINADNIPTELYDCAVSDKKTECVIAVQWYLFSNQTEVSFVVDARKRGVAPSDHTVTIDMAFGKDGLDDQVQHSLYYFCSEDKCNGASQLKRLLQSLTLKDQLMDLKALLQPSAQFDGNWCLLFANQTAEPCEIPTTVDPTNCKQCSTQYTTESGVETLCAGCYTDAVKTEFLAREILFNLTDRTLIENRKINCRSEQQCNSVHTGDLIRQKSTIEFDFARFLNASNRNNPLSFFNGIALGLVVFVINRMI